MRDSNSAKHNQPELIYSKSRSVINVALCALISLSVLSACTSKPPPPPPPPRNPLPPVPKADEIKTIDPKQDPSILPKPTSES